MRGYLAAAILANVEEYLNRFSIEKMPIGQRFDLIAGTSIGGILGLGLAAGHSAAELRDLLLTLVPTVFGRGNRRTKIARWFWPKYHTGPLREELEKLFGETTLADLQTDACVTSLSLIDAKPRLHKSDYFSRNAGRISTKLVDVALATAAAPTYFPAHSSEHSANLVDGGLIANNPAIIALIDAMKFQRPSKRGTPVPDLASSGDRSPLILSIGTGDPGPLPYDYGKLVDGGMAHWARPIHEVIFLGQAQLVDFQVKFLLEAAGGRYLRINPKLNVPVELDGVKNFDELRNKADVDSDCEQFLRINFLGQPQA